MMGEQKSERELFSYAVNLEKRVRSDHPLRRVAAAIDFKFVREKVAHRYGSKGQVSVDPEVIMKMMFLLFFDDVASERELMKIIAERLDISGSTATGWRTRSQIVVSYPRRGRAGARRSLQGSLCRRSSSVWERTWSMGASCMWIRA